MWINDVFLGDYNANQTVDFTGFAGGGVSSFKILGIDSGTDPNSSTAFPIRLSYDHDFASLTMDALVVPEPSSVVLAGLGLLGIGFVAWRKKYRRV